MGAHSTSPANSTILVIDDSRSIQRLLSMVLQPHGYLLYFASSGEEGLQRCLEIEPDLILLDIILPGANGFELCQKLLELVDVPIIFLSTLADEDAIVRGLEMGAVDYVEKPFRAKVLIARIRSALRHYVGRREAGSPPHAESAGTYDDGYLSINMGEQSVSVAGKSINLTVTEYNLLTYLYMRAGQVCTMDQILEHVWGENEGSRSSLYTYIRRLRNKLELADGAHHYISVRHGIGYCFEKK